VSSLLERAGGFFPALVALALPVVFIPILGDLYILPRASIVIAGACLGIGLALLTPSRHHLGALRWPLLAAAAAALLAFAFSINWGLSFAGSYTRYESLPMRLSYLGLLASAAWLIRTRAQRDLAVAAFVAGSSIASAQALLQAWSHAPFRPDGNLGNANLLAALIAMAAPLAVDRAFRGGAFAAAWAAAVVVMFAGIIATTSRSGGLGAFAGVLAVGVLAVKGRAVIGAAVLWLASVAVLLAVFLLSPLRALNDDPFTLRLHLWQDGIRMVAARPITGWGLDTTGLAFGRFLSQDYASLVTFDRIHSGPLDIAATQGVVGLAALTAVLFVLAQGAWRNRLDRDVAALSGALIGYTAWVALNFDWAPATGAFWLLAGMLWSAMPAAREVETVGERGVVWRSALAVGLVAVTIAFAVLPILADAWYVRGRSDLAIRVDPFQAQYHWSIATLPELRRAAELGETDPGMYVQLGDAELRAGNRAAAIQAYRRALEIDPYYTPASQRLAAATG
jgi:O-antigen ligase